SRLLPDDRDHRLVVELGVVEAVEKVNRAGPRGRDADACLPGELGMRTGHEGRHLLVADLDELGPALRAPEGTDDPVDPVAGVSVYPLNSPLAREPGEEVIGDLFAHGTSHVSR